MRTHRLWHSILSVVLVLALMLGMSATTLVSAVDLLSADTINYVSFGDSMTNGYGIEGYETELGENVNGYLQIAPDAYPNLFAEWLEGQNPGTEVNLTQLATSGMRVEDMYYALTYKWEKEYGTDWAHDPTYYMTEEEFAAAGLGDNYTYDHFVDGKFDDIVDWDNYNLAYYCTVCEKTFKGSLADGNIYITDTNYDQSYYDSQGNEYKYSDNVCKHVRVDNLTKNYPVDDADVVEWYTWDTDRDGNYEQTPPTYKYVIPYCASAVGNDYGSVWFGNSTAAVAAQYQNAVRDADIISIGAGNANFGVFILHRFVGATVSTDWGSDDFDWICADDYINSIDNEIAKSIALQAAVAVKEQLGLPNEHIPAISYEELRSDDTGLLEIKVLYNVVMYTTVSYMVTYRNMLDRIVELNDNDDLEIMIVGLMNAMNGVTLITEDGEEINLTETMETVFGYINNYLAFLASYLQTGYPDEYANVKVYYAEEPTVDVLANNYDTSVDVVRKRFIEAITDKVWWLVKDMFNSVGEDFGVSLTDVELSDVKSYKTWEENWNKWTSGSVPEDALQAKGSEKYSSAVYLAFEDAIVYGVQSGEIDMSYFGMLSDMSSITGVFGSVGAKLAAVLATEVEADISDAVAKWAAMNYAKVEVVMAQFNNQIDAATAAPIAYLASVGIAPEAYTPAAIGAALQKSPIGVSVFTTVLHPALAKALIDTDEFDTLLNLFGRMVIGDGLGTHPSIEGYKDLANAVIAAYSDPSFELDYTSSKDSYYVSLGDVSAISDDTAESFADKLADEFNYTNGRYAQLAVDGMRADDLYYILDPENHIPDEYSTVKYGSSIEALNAKYVSEIAKADLITLSFTSNSFIEFATNQLDLAGISSYLADYDVENYEADLELYLGENTELVEGMLGGLISGAGSSNNAIMNTFIDNYTYAVVGYMLHYSKIVNQIHEINPTAEVILLGMDNSLSGLVLTDSSSGTRVALGDTFDTVINLINSFNRTCALTSANTVYIDVPATESKGPQNEAVQAEVMKIVEEQIIPEYVEQFKEENPLLAWLPIDQIIEYILQTDSMKAEIDSRIDEALPGWDDEVTSFNGEVSLLRFMLEIALVGTDGMLANDNGHEYVKDQIMSAMTVEYIYELGDVNHDGVINTKDALAVLEHYVGSVSASVFDVDLADVNGDRLINTKDALDILYYYVGTITEFSGSK